MGDVVARIGRGSRCYRTPEYFPEIVFIKYNDSFKRIEYLILGQQKKLLWGGGILLNNDQSLNVVKWSLSLFFRMVVAMPFSRNPRIRKFQRDLDSANTEIDKLRKQLEKSESSTLHTQTNTAPITPHQITVTADVHCNTNNANFSSQQNSNQESDENVIYHSWNDTITSENSPSKINCLPSTHNDVVATSDTDKLVEESNQNETCNEKSSPMVQARALAEQMNITPNPDRIKTILPLTITAQQVHHAPTTIKRHLFQSPASGKKYHGTIAAISDEIGLSRDYIFRDKSRTQKRKRDQEKRQDEIVAFLTREDNSYVLPSKKDQGQNQQKYALADTLRNLHRKYCAENSADLSISLSSFCRLRPKYVKLSHYLRRQVCLCKIHANVSLLCVAVQGLPKSTAQLIEMKDADIKKIINETGTENINFKTWEKVSKEHNGKTVNHTKLVDKSLVKKAFIKHFTKQLPPFRLHCERVGAQYKALKHLEDVLPINHCIVQLDYAENWNCSYLQEITSAYYSKDQITVHPMVTKQREHDELVVTSYAGVSNVTAHSFPTTFVFITELVAKLKSRNPDINTIHFVSDSPSSQYRNRYVCQMLLRFEHDFKIRAVWNWLESGHGKGPCDGVGGSMKRLADRIVRTNTTIQDASDFYNYVSKESDKVELIYITEQQVNQIKSEIDAWECKPVKGLMQMHEAAAINGKLFVKPTSCYNTCCFTNGKVTDGCNDWICCNVSVCNEGADDSEYISSSGDESDNEEEDNIPLVGMPNSKSDTSDDENLPLKFLAKSKIPQKGDEDPDGDTTMCTTAEESSDDTDEDIPLKTLMKKK